MDIYHTFGIQVPRVYSYQVMCICSSFVGKSWQCRCFPRKQLEKCWRCCFVRSFVLHQIWMIWISRFRVAGFRGDLFKEGVCLFVFSTWNSTPILWANWIREQKTCERLGIPRKSMGSVPGVPNMPKKHSGFGNYYSIGKFVWNIRFRKRFNPSRGVFRLSCLQTISSKMLLPW